MSPDRLSPIWAQPPQPPDWSLPEWEIVLGQAMHARLPARLAQHLLAHGWLAQVPWQPRQYLEGALRLADRQRHEVHWEVDCIRRALRDIDTPIVLLKGAAYLMAGLPAGRGRIFSDIDLMVRPEQINAVERALFVCGWISEERDAYNNRYYRQWMHEIPPLVHVRRNTVIDLHHTITPPTSRHCVAGEALFAQLVPIDDSGKLFVLAPVDMVLHSAVHLFQEGEFSHGLRDLLDIKDLLQHFSRQPDFWPALLDRAAALGLQIPLHHALHHLQRLFGDSVPAPWQARVKQLAPPALSGWLMAWLLQLALRPDHPSCNTRWTRLARWLLYVRGHALRMPLHLVLPHLLRKAWLRHFAPKP